MENRSQLSKLGALRAKTDQQLIHFINKRLELGLHLASAALESAGNSATVRESHAIAERAYAEAAALLPLVAAITGAERSGLESSLERLRELLDRLSTRGPLPPRNERAIAELARSFWKARGCPEGSAEEDWYRAEQQLRTKISLLNSA